MYFKMIGHKENMLKISWQSGVPARSYQQKKIAKTKKKTWFLCDKHLKSLSFI